MKAGSKLILCSMGIAAALSMPNLHVQAAENEAAGACRTAVFIPMPGFVVEQWNMPRLMVVSQDAKVFTMPDKNAPQLGLVLAGECVHAWGQTDSGWYFIECNGTLGYVRYEAAYFQSDGSQTADSKEAALQVSDAQLQSMAAAGVVFIGDSRMETLKESVENNLGVCPAAVVAKGGSRYEWFRDSGVPQADKIIGKGSKVVINMGVNDLGDADDYAQLVNTWAAVWTQRGATVYYASVNPVWANSFGMTEERVELFNNRLQSQLAPYVIWLDSHSYLMASGVHATDGVHYKDDTNLILFHYYMTMIGAM